MPSVAAELAVRTLPFVPTPSLATVVLYVRISPFVVRRLPVPPYAVAIGVACQVPVVIVPTVVQDDPMNERVPPPLRFNPSPLVTAVTILVLDGVVQSIPPDAAELAVNT
jgi:hypothetical protein